MKSEAFNFLQKLNFNQSQQNQISKEKSINNNQALNKFKNIQFPQGDRQQPEQFSQNLNQNQNFSQINPQSQIVYQSQIKQSQKIEKFERFSQLISQQQMEIEEQNNQFKQQQQEYQQNKLKLEQELQLQEQKRNQCLEQLKEKDQQAMNYFNQDLNDEVNLNQQNLFSCNLTQFEEIDENVLPTGYIKQKRRTLQQQTQINNDEEDYVAVNDQFNKPLELKNVKSFHTLKSMIPQNKITSLAQIKEQLSQQDFFIKVQLSIVTLRDYQIQEDSIFCIFEDESGIILGQIDQDIITDDFVKDMLINPQFINLKKGSSFLLEDFTAYKDKQKIFFINIVKENIQQILY